MTLLTAKTRKKEKEDFLSDTPDREILHHHLVILLEKIILPLIILRKKLQPSWLWTSF